MPLRVASIQAKAAALHRVRRANGVYREHPMVAGKCLLFTIGGPGGVEAMRLRVLIVDDSETIRRMLGAILRSRQWTVCGEAENGQSGVKEFHRLKPDVVLLDLSMPDITGIEAAKLMFATDPTVPLILFTILEIEGIEGAAREAGIRAIVPKIKAWNLIRSIEGLVNQKSRQQAY
jgi:two-component system, chemotaxis family, chemotaxis protein CheY